MTVYSAAFIEAVDYVRSEIDDNLFCEQVTTGTTIEVGDMRCSDCIPLSVVDGRHRTWKLDGVEGRGGASILSPIVPTTKRTLVALYRCQ